MSAQAPVGTTLALLERQLKVMTAVQARLHYSFKQELKLLVKIIEDYTDPDYDYQPEEGRRTARKEDYSQVDIIPVSDPNAATMSQRVVQYQAVIQMAQMAPDIYDLPQLHRRMLEVLGVKHAEKLVPLPDDQKPRDPVAENMAVLKGEPVKAFMYQDHEAHIKVHMAAMQDPLIMQLIGQNPRAPQMQAAMQAHISEHVGFGYRQKIEQQLGMPLPPEDEKLPPEVEVALSGMMAQAAQQVLQQNQAQAQQQQAQQQAQDPVLQMQKQELAIRQQEAQTKAQKVAQDGQIAQKKLQQDAAEALAKIQLEKQRTAAQLLQRQNIDSRRLNVDATKAAIDAKRDTGRFDAEAARMEQEMAARSHAQDLEHRQAAHDQKLRHQEAQARARAKMMREQAQTKEKPTK